MNEQEYIDQQLERYGEAFDFYMDCGKMPETLPPDDILGGYMASMLKDNSYLEQKDPLWKEVLKEELMNYFTILLKGFYAIEQASQQEFLMIEGFRNSDIETKRGKWKEVYQHIKAFYTPKEVHIEGYEKLFGTENKDAVMGSLLADWSKANEQKQHDKKQALLEQSKTSFNIHLQEWGNTDYKRRKKIERTFYQYPALQEIVRIMGREEPENKDEVDETILKYRPIILSHTITYEEVQEVTAGNNLNHILPNEISLLAEKQTESLFYYKMASHELQQFSNQLLISHNKVEEGHKKMPRLEKGPIIVSMDTSGSMSGEPKTIATSLLMQLLHTAKKQRRKCFLITFSVHSQALELISAYTWSKLKKFLENGFSGGTDGEEMLHAAIQALQKDNFSMADVLIISDFYFPLPISATQKEMEKEQGKGTRFYGLQIGTRECKYESVLNKVWKV